VTDLLYVSVALVPAHSQECGVVLESVCAKWLRDIPSSAGNITSIVLALASSHVTNGSLIFSAIGLFIIFEQAMLRLFPEDYLSSIKYN
jgi:hypothetical protein